MPFASQYLCGCMSTVIPGLTYYFLNDVNHYMETQESLANALCFL